MSVSSLANSASATPTANPVQTKAEAKIEKKIDTNTAISTEEFVKKYFSDVPVLIEVARCESHFRQHEDGEVLTGVVNEFDKGVMQINEMYHLEQAKKMGLDIHTLEGNLSYARYLFEREGLRPWNSSSPCWKKTAAYANHAELALNN
jgi:hypothetical protein